MKFAPVFLLFFSIYGFGQTGGRSPFAFTQNAPNAAISSMGGIGIGLPSNDPASAFQNPALINPSMVGKLSLSHHNFLSDAGISHVSYALKLKKMQFFKQWLEYDTETKEAANLLFNSSEYQQLLSPTK